MDVPAIEPAADGRDDSFDWDVIPLSHPLRVGTRIYWNFTWSVLREQDALLAAEGIEVRDRYQDATGSSWAPLIDLQLLDVDDNSCDWIDGGSFHPLRQIGPPADDTYGGIRLPAGTALRFEGSIPDQMHEELGSSFWSLPSGDDAARLGVRFLASAFEGRWGGAAHLGDHLIVPAGHPLLDDPSRSRQLMGELRSMVLDMRRRAGLTSEGMPRGRNVHRDDSSTGLP